MNQVHKVGLQLHTVETVDFLDACRRCDVDLGQLVTNDVDANEYQSVLLQFGS